MMQTLFGLGDIIDAACETGRARFLSMQCVTPIIG